MIAQLRGRLLEKIQDKDHFKIILDVQGVGYEVFMPRVSESRLTEGQSFTLYIRESVTAFDGATTLYGFLSREENDLFMQLRENVDGMGPKKALESMDKISKSMPDFKRAIIEGDVQVLVSLFGFTKKTAEKLTFSLKGKVDGWSVTGTIKWSDIPRGKEAEALSGLLNLGYSDAEAREALAKAKERVGAEAQMERLIQESLRIMGGRLV